MTIFALPLSWVPGRIASAILAAMVLGGTTASVQAIGSGYSQPYGEAGSWLVFKNPDATDSCFAQSEAGPAMLRLVYSDYMANWEMHIALWGQAPEIAGQFSFGKNATSLAPKSFIRTLSWARYQILEDEESGFRKEAALTLQIERGPETFPLSGSSAAMDMVLKCVQERAQN